jgi:SNF2 family DNA or RNA helicase
MSERQRVAVAARIHDLRDFHLPHLAHFNYDPCPAHETIEDGAMVGCMACGVEPRRHQRVGAAWLYFVKRGMLADVMGTGKTIQLALVLAWMKETGELDETRCIVVARGAAIPQHTARLSGLLPTCAVTGVVGSILTRAERIERYIQRWDVLVVSQQTFVNDIEMLLRLNCKMVVADDMDALRNPTNAAAVCIKRLARDCVRSYPMSGTPLQKRLPELHSALEVVGGDRVFGPKNAFVHRYVVIEPVERVNPRTGRVTRVKKEVGIKHADELKVKLQQFALRRTPADIDDVSMPEIQPSTVWLDLNPNQAKAYAQLRAGARQIIKDLRGRSIGRAKAGSVWMIGQQICSGLASFGVADDSSKLDWIMGPDCLEGDMENEKLVVFINFKKNLRAFQSRLRLAGIGAVDITGDEPDVNVRQQRVARFWSDPNTQVLVGTTLNLQVARHLVYVDTIMNPARMAQMAGRIRRDGSRHHTVYLHHLLCEGTQESSYPKRLAKEQAVADYIWGEQSEQFEGLSPLEMLMLIAA